MKDDSDNLRFRLVGKGSILNQMEGIIGRTLTQTFLDQNQQTYVKVNGEIIPLTDKHGYLE
jgi:hypothetical protein